MSDPEDFLTRWARRKREAADEPAEETRDTSHPPASRPVAEAGGGTQAPAAGEAAEPPFDLGTLPSIESIAADTDIRAFFAPGVPAELRVAALRRAWIADPKIRDFVGLNDYDFDFHTPGAIPGFGPLEMTDELRREVGRIVSNFLPDADKPSPEPVQSGPLVESVPAAQPMAAIEEINAQRQALEETAIPASRSLPDVAGSFPEKEQSKLAQMQIDKDHAASHQNIGKQENLQAPARRQHGSALPK